MDTKNKHFTGKLKTIIDDHNKSYNPSGMPFKGTKRTQPENSTDEESNAVVIGSLVTGSGQNQRGIAASGSESHCELLVKDKALYIHGKTDGFVSALKPLCGIW